MAEIDDVCSVMQGDDLLNNTFADEKTVGVFFLETNEIY